MKKAFVTWGDYTNLELGGNCDYEVVQGGRFGIVIGADDACFKRIKTERNGDTFQVVFKKKWGRRDHVNRPVLRISLPELTQLKVFGPAACIVRGFEGVQTVISGKYSEKHTEKSNDIYRENVVKS